MEPGHEPKQVFSRPHIILETAHYGGRETWRRDDEEAKGRKQQTGTAILRVCLLLTAYCLLASLRVVGLQTYTSNLRGLRQQYLSFRTGGPVVPPAQDCALCSPLHARGRSLAR